VGKASSDVGRFNRVPRLLVAASLFEPQITAQERRRPRSESFGVLRMKRGGENQHPYPFADTRYPFIANVSSGSGRYGGPVDSLKICRCHGRELTSFFSSRHPTVTGPCEAAGAALRKKRGGGQNASRTASRPNLIRLSYRRAIRTRRSGKRCVSASRHNRSSARARGEWDECHGSVMRFIGWSYGVRVGFPQCSSDLGLWHDDAKWPRLGFGRGRFASRPT
jgi:hypothetical protein